MNYKCFSFIDRQANEQMRQAHIPFQSAGYGNGYVAIPPSHPLYGIDYKLITFPSIHGGITFSGYSTIIKKYWDANYQEVLHGELPDNYWVFGFDTLQPGDNLENCPREYIISQLKILHKFLEEYQP